MKGVIEAKYRLIIASIPVLFVFVFIGYSIISIVDKTQPKKIHRSAHKTDNNNLKNRGDILDRNGQILATTIKTNDLIINPSIFEDPKTTIKFLSNTLKIKLSDDKIKKIRSDQKYFKLKKNISKSDYYKILKLGIPGVSLEKSYIRKYPAKSLGSHILGNVDTNGNGISGIELTKNKLLSSGQNIKLSINSYIQSIVKNLVSIQINKFNAKGGAAIIMDIKNGELISIISLPDYDNNNLNNLSKEQKFNKATKGIYELGSTIKIFTAAMALESGIIKDDDLIDVSKPLKVSSSKRIKDIRPLNFSINLPEVIVHSSNIGSAQIARLIGPKLQNHYYKILDFDKKIDLELVEIGKPKINNDQRMLSTMTKSFGYGLQISPLHLTKGTATVLNGGFDIQPTLLKNNISNFRKKRIFSNETSKTLRSILYLVVNNKNGTGKKAKANGYLVGGKTGTAHKVENGLYSEDKKIVAFTGAFPMHSPKYAFSIIIDSPKPQNFSHNMATGGWVVAPVVKKIINRIAPILKVSPLTQENIEKIHSLKKYNIRGVSNNSGI